jgi:hypothetical protein
MPARVKTETRNSDHSSLSSFEIKSEWSYLTTFTYTLVALTGKNLTFTTLGIHISNIVILKLSFKPVASHGHTFCIDSTLLHDVQR